MAFPVGAAILGGSSILGGIFGGKGAKKAAKAQTQMGREALALQERMFQQGREDLAPWRAAGGQAIGQGLAMLQPGYNHTTSPGYQFRFSEGQRAVDSSAASKGMLMSGGTLKDLTRFGQGVAADDFNDQFNRTMSVASGGQQASTNSASMGQSYANNASNILGNIGQAKASGYAGQNQAFQGTLSNLIGLYGMGGFGGGGSSGGGGFTGLSDARAKTDVERVGTLPNGLGIYEWTYKADVGLAGRYRGVMAQEVAQIAPEMLGEPINGYMTVKYQPERVG